MPFFVVTTVVQMKSILDGGQSSILLRRTRGLCNRSQQCAGTLDSAILQIPCQQCMCSVLSTVETFSQGCSRRSLSAPARLCFFRIRVTVLATDVLLFSKDTEVTRQRLRSQGRNTSGNNGREKTRKQAPRALPKDTKAGDRNCNARRRRQSESSPDARAARGGGHGTCHQRPSDGQRNPPQPTLPDELSGLLRAAFAFSTFLCSCDPFMDTIRSIRALLVICVRLRTPPTNAHTSQVLQERNFGVSHQRGQLLPSPCFTTRSSTSGHCGVVPIRHWDN